MSLPTNPTIPQNAYNDYLAPQWTSINYAVIGNAFSSSASLTAATTSQAGMVGIRKEAKIEWPGAVRNDAAGKDQYDGANVKLELDLWQTDMYTLANTYYLSYYPVCFAGQLGQGDIFNFVENTANPPFSGTTGSPNGSIALGLTFEYDVTEKDATLKWMGAGKAHPLEIDWMYANASSLNNSQTAGPAHPSLSAMGYSQTRYGIPGVGNIITLSGNNMSLFGENVKLSIKSTSPVSDFRGRPISRFLDFEVSGEFLPMRANPELQNYIAKRNSDFTTSIQLWTGFTVTFVNSLSFVGSPTFGDGKATVPFKMSAKKIGYDPVGVSNNIQFNFSTQTMTVNRPIYG